MRVTPDAEPLKALYILIHYIKRSTITFTLNLLFNNGSVVKKVRNHHNWRLSRIILKRTCLSKKPISDDLTKNSEAKKFWNMLYIKPSA